MILRVIRLLVALLVWVALAVGAATIAHAESGRARAPVTEAEADAFAQAVNLQPSDLPGAKTLPQTGGAMTTSHVDDLSCGHRAYSHHVGGGASLLTDGYGFVASAVLVTPSDALARAEMAALLSRTGRICLARKLGEIETVEAETTTSSHTVKATFVPVAKLLGPEAVALHVLAEPPPLNGLEPNLRRGPKEPLLHVDAVFFRVGPAEILFLAFGSRRFPPATEGRLLALLHTRAEARKL
jgi:hypothetical protein